MYGIALADVEATADKILTRDEKDQLLREMYDALDNENVDCYKQMVQIEGYLDDFKIPNVIGGSVCSTADRVLLLCKEYAVLKAVLGGCDD